MTIKKLAITIIMLLLGASAQAAIIDDFNGGDIHIDAPGSDTQTYSNSIGGSRTIDLTKSGPLGVAADVISGFYVHSADSLTTGISLLTWDANGAGLGGQDLTEGTGVYSFLLDIFSIDQGEIDFTLSVTDTLSNTFSYLVQNAGVGVLAISFSKFSTVDLTSVDSISLLIEGDVSSDLVLNSLTTVPEPTLLVMLGLGLALMSVKFKRNSISVN